MKQLKAIPLSAWEGESPCTEPPMWKKHSVCIGWSMYTKGTHTLALTLTRYTCIHTRIHTRTHMQRFKIISLAAVGTWLCWEGDSCCITSAFCSLQRLPESHVSAAAEHSRAEHTQTDTKADVHVHPHLHTLFFKEGHTHRQKAMKIFNKKTHRFKSLTCSNRYTSVF